MLTLFSLLQESPHGRRLVYAIVSLGLIHVAGTIGYLMLAPPTLGVVDALFMTFITISTIGYEELIPLTGRPRAEIFTIVIAFAGIGAMTFIFSTLTTFMLETNLNRAYRRKRMEIDSQRMKGHYIICGAGRVGSYVIEELTRRRRLDRGPGERHLARRRTDRPTSGPGHHHRRRDPGRSIAPCRRAERRRPVRRDRR
ncbi:MAG: potassium channel family protein [Burkholderiaceae bacterium]